MPPQFLSLHGWQFMENPFFKKSMKYYLIAGEASGDLHGSNLILALKKRDSKAQIRCWGGDLMQQAGGELQKHYRDLAFMGFIEVVKNLATILKNISFCKKDISAWQPDVLILIDYPGFNLRIAKWAKKQGIKVFYYISPQIWAWHSSRVHGIKKSVDRMFVILPFEQDFYKKYSMDVDFVGHPLLDAIAKISQQKDFRKEFKLSEKPIIALLPGSRKQEIARMLPIMIAILPYFRDYQFVVAAAPSISMDFYKNIIGEKEIKLAIIPNRTYTILQNATAALVTSGTATLETALFKVPQVVCYKGSFISYHIARHLVNVKYISLVNLTMDKPLVKELIQSDLTIDNLKSELEKILNTRQRLQIIKGYNELIEKLGNQGASDKAAQLMLSYLKT